MCSEPGKQETYTYLNQYTRKTFSHSTRLFKPSQPPTTENKINQHDWNVAPLPQFPLVREMRRLQLLRESSLNFLPSKFPRGFRAYCLSFLPLLPPLLNVTEPPFHSTPFSLYARQIKTPRCLLLAMCPTKTFLLSNYQRFLTKFFGWFIQNIIWSCAFDEISYLVLYVQNVYSCLVPLYSQWFLM